MSILILAPTGIVVKPLCQVFEHSGITYDTCTTPQHCLQLYASGSYTAVIVIHTDTVQHLLEFHNQWKALRRKGAFIVVSQRQSGVERANALNAGINSYHITPFSYSQLVQDVAKYEYSQDCASHIIAAHGLEIDTISRSARFEDRFLRLTRKQYELLTLFVQYPGQVFNRVQIWERVWTSGEYPLANTVDVHVNRLRKALPVGFRDKIETLYGFGYRMRPR